MRARAECPGPLARTLPRVTPRVRVVFGEVVTPAPLDPATSQGGEPTEAAIQTSPPRHLMLDDCKRAIAALGDWIRQHDDQAGSDEH